MRVTSGDIGADSIFVDLLTREVAFHYASSVPVCQCANVPVCQCANVEYKALSIPKRPCRIGRCSTSHSYSVSVFGSEESILDLG